MIGYGNMELGSCIMTLEFNDGTIIRGNAVSVDFSFNTNLVNHGMINGETISIPIGNEYSVNVELSSCEMTLSEKERLILEENKKRGEKKSKTIQRLLRE